MAELTHSFFRGDWEEAKELQLSYLPLMQALFSQVNPIPIKAPWPRWDWTAACFGHPSGKWTKEPAGTHGDLAGL